MERVAFLIEGTNERLGCLLNPESLVVRRLAGVRPRRSATGRLTGAELADDPLLYTGGGTTELTLDLLFDVSLAGSSIATEDVRDLTGPLWRLAENSAQPGGYGAPPVVRFIWGKSWNIPVVVVAAAERLEHFTPEGIPRRSWLRLRLLRVGDGQNEYTAARPLPVAGLWRGLEIPARGEASMERSYTHQIVGGGAGDERGAGERLDQIAFDAYGNPAHWRLLALFNDIADPLRIPAGFVLRIPLLSALSRRARGAL